MLALLKILNKAQEEFIESLNIVQIDDIIRNQQKVTIQLSPSSSGSSTKTKVKKPKSTSKGKAKPVVAKADSSTIEAQLMGASSRSEGSAILQKLKKPRLVKLAEELDVALNKKETANSIRSKIVEAMVGFRLDSEAIRKRG